ncbi:MAG: DUF4276 family protein [Caldilineaceae bacterium]
MVRNKIYAIVEGQGEANRPIAGGRSAVAVLIQKLLMDLHCWSLFPVEKTPPFRMSYSEFFRGDKFERAIRYHKNLDDCAALLVLLDMDDDCPKTQAFALAKRIAAMESLPFSVVIVCARKEYESWFLASLESIHDGERYDHDPEEIRDAKGWLRKKFGYKPTIHQARYTQKIDPTIAYAKSRSFRRLYHAFEEIVAAVADGGSVITPVVTSKKGQ